MKAYAQLDAVEQALMAQRGVTPEAVADVGVRAGEDTALDDVNAIVAALTRPVGHS